MATTSDSSERETQNYSPAQRARNQLSVVLGAAVVLAILVLSGLMQSWTIGSFIAGATVIIGVAAVVWWLFASSSAKPLPTDRKHARWPFLSKKTLDEITGQ